MSSLLDLTQATLGGKLSPSFTITGGENVNVSPRLRFYFAGTDKLPKAARNLIISLIEAVIISLERDGTEGQARSLLPLAVGSHAEGEKQASWPLHIYR